MLLRVGGAVVIDVRAVGRPAQRVREAVRAITGELRPDARAWLHHRNLGQAVVDGDEREEVTVGRQARMHRDGLATQARARPLDLREFARGPPGDAHSRAGDERECGGGDERTSGPAAPRGGPVARVGTSASAGAGAGERRASANG